MGIDKSKRQLSLKDLFGAVTWVAVAAAMFRFGFTHEVALLTFVGVFMVLVGLGAVIGFLLAGRRGVAAGAWCGFIVFAVLAYAVTP